MKPKVLLVDDQELLLADIRRYLDAQYEVLTATTERAALDSFTTAKPAVAVIDLALNRADPLDLGGLRLIERFMEQDPATRIIVLTGNEDDTNALEAVRMGAYDYYSKPIRLAELKVMIQRAIEVHRIHQRLNTGRGEPAQIIHTQALHRAEQLAHDAAAEMNPTGGEVNLKRAKKAIEVEFVKKALARNNGIVSRAARELGISRVNLYELIEKHHIGVQEFKAHKQRATRQNSSEA